MSGKGSSLFSLDLDLSAPFAALDLELKLIHNVAPRMRAKKGGSRSVHH